MRGKRGSERVDVELVDVELLEDDAVPGAEPDGQGGRAASEAERRGGGRARWIGVGVVVALVIVVVGVNVQQAREDAAQRAARAELPWIAPSLAEPLRELWRASGVLIGSTEDLALIMTVTDDYTVQTVRAVDLGSGQARWELGEPSRDRYCSTAVDPNGVATALYCVDPATFDSARFGEGEDEGGRDELLGRQVFDFFDLATGQPTGAVAVPGPVRALQGVGEDLVVLAEDDHGGTAVMRIDTTEPAVTWTHERSAEDSDADSVWLYADPAGEVVYIEGGAAVTLDAATGEPVVAPEPNEVVAARYWGWRWGAEPPVWRDRTITVGESVAGAPPQVEVRAPDGSALFAMEGMPWLPWYDDGLGPDVLVVAEMGADGVVPTGLVGLDGSTGAERWRAPAPNSPQACLQVATLMVMCGGDLQVLDVATGQLLWQNPASFVIPVTDGERLLVVGTDRVLGERGMEVVHVLSAHDLRTGEVRWSIEAPAEVMHLEVRGGVVIAMTPDHLIAYG